MANVIAPIVEGQGDVISIPIVLRRLCALLGRPEVRVLRPARISRTRLVRAGELERAVERAGRELAGRGGILVVLDADDDLPCVLGPSLAERARKARADVPTRVVLPCREKEAWLLAALASLRGIGGVPVDARPPDLPEKIRGAKERFSAILGRPYSEIADQAALCARFDLTLARERSASFDKLCRDVAGLLAA